MRVPLNKNEYGYSWLVGGNNGNLSFLEPYEDYSDSHFVHQMATIYGTVELFVHEGVDADHPIYECLGHQAIGHTPGTYIECNEVYSKLGFIEGIANIDTSEGFVACLVYNGVLYPILSEYDEEIDDHWTLLNVFMNGDNECAALSTMLTRPDRYLAYDESHEGSHWSPVENYLHTHLNMQIVPKIGYVPPVEIGVGNPLPGPFYNVIIDNG